MTSQVVTALSPEFVAALQAAKQFVANLGTDPTKLPLTAGPALQVFVGQLTLQAAPAMNAVWSVAVADANAKLDQLIAGLTPAPAK